MLNFEIAKIFYDIADLQELLGIQWKPRAFRKAAQAIEAIPEAIEDIYKKGGIKALKEIPGVGERIAKKIVQFIETGKVNEYERLKAKVPAGLATLISIESIGPKKAIRLWRELKIKNIDDLKKAISQHKIAKLPGFGPKSEENIAAGIGLFEKGKGRFLLGEILPIAQTIISRLKKISEIGHISEAGSIRRRKETVGDLDILVTIKKPSAAIKVMDTFTTMPEVARVLAKGLTKSTVVLRNGLQADVRVLDDNVFGAALQYFTGNVEHNVALRRIGIEKGYKLSEYGLFDRKTGKLVAGKTENEVYKKLGLQYIEPELREMRGEIEAAQKRRLPKLITLGDIKGDFHIHTNWSDGGASIEEMVSAAKARGYEYVCISDHSKTRAIARGLDEAKLLSQLQEIKSVQKKFKDIHILTGAEVDILADGSFDYPEKILKKLNVVIGSVHTGWKSPRKIITGRIIKALENKNLDILGHPTGRIINQRKPFDLDLEQIYAVAREKKKILEIDSIPDRLDLNDVNIKAAIEAGVMLCINSDAHTPDQLRYMEFGVYNARRGWAEAKNILNTRKLSELSRFLPKLRD
ncbi:MAG: DNA polymerase/3'-5' exonuclease PolX [Candidatus Nanoarchaeia archaeon]